MHPSPSDQPCHAGCIGCAPLVLPDRPSNPFPSSYAIDTISPLATTSQKRAALPPPHHPYRPLTSSQVSRYTELFPPSPLGLSEAAADSNQEPGSKAELSPKASLKSDGRPRSTSPGLSRRYLRIVD
ncbi:hypothetical protein V2G26_000805 [Clonostachys chloroleuca]